jgi:hypothetical protein
VLQKAGWALPRHFLKVFTKFYTIKKNDYKCGKAKRSFTVFVRPPNGTEEKITLKGTTGMARLRGSVR